MIPTELQDSLAKRMADIFKDVRFKNPDNLYVPLNIFKQHLPRKSNNDIEHFPHLIIQLLEGEQESRTDPQQAQVMFIAGVFDDQDTFQGYRDVATILQKVISELQRNPNVDNRFELNYPVRWAFHDEDVYPYYFGAAETVWDVPVSIREDVEGMI